MHIRLWIATAALCFAAGSATAEPASTGQCNSVWENGRLRTVCSNPSSGLPQQSGNPSRQEIPYTIKQTAPIDGPRTDNFCGPGYRMAPGGCQAAGG
jgi:hypothetical protein